MFRLGYNTNGLAHHRIRDALELCAELGYEAVAITPDAGALDPYDLDPDEVMGVRRAAEELGLELAVESGARFLLDKKRKHWPTLLEPEQELRERRIDFLLRSIDLAADLGASVLSIWAGAAPMEGAADGRGAGGAVADRPGAGVAHEELWERLCAGVARVLDRGRAQGVQIGFEPEPGMFIERPAGYGELVARLGAAGKDLGLTLDIGHLLCTGDLPVEAVIREWAPRLVMVQLDDCAAGVHEHRMFGEGELDLAAALGALIEVHYKGIAAVELSRDGHRGAQAAEEALFHLRKALASRS